MTIRFLRVLVVLCLTGCAQPIKTTTPVTPALPSRQMLGHETAKATRDSLNTALRLQQIAVQTNSTLMQQAWENQVFAASPNVIAKVTTMINPADARGRIMEQQILTYYDHGTMRYATNFFDKAKSP